MQRFSVIYEVRCIREFQKHVGKISILFLPQLIICGRNIAALSVERILSYKTDSGTVTLFDLSTRRSGN
jgi:hypothetical protein